MLRRWRGISLVETLVVMAIVMLIGSIILPTAVLLVRMVRSFGPHH